MNYETALQLATEVKAILAPYCTRVEIAGGVRRHKAEPHDLEIVCIPLIETIFAQESFFGEPSLVEKNRLDIFIQKQFTAGDGVISHGDPDKSGKRAPSGPKYYRLKFKNEKLDIFAVLPPAQWGTVFLIRTGDADFSHEYVTRLWKYGLKSTEGHIERSWSDALVQSNPVKYAPITINTPEELDCFKLIEMEYVEPEKRTRDAFK